MDESSLRIVFFGSAEIGLPTLAALCASRHAVAAVVTQPDRPGGRGRRLAATCIKQAANEHHLHVFQPESVNAPGFRRRIAALGADLFVIVAFGQILGGRLLAIPRLGAINLHASLLPEYRGAGPIHWAILHGRRRSGVSIMRVTRRMDAGEVFRRIETGIDPDETAEDLARRLAALGAEPMLETIDQLAAGAARGEPQDERRATYAPKLTKHTGRLVVDRPAVELHNLVRGTQPWPGASLDFTAAATGKRERVTVLRSRRLAPPIDPPPGPVVPGQVLSAAPLVMATGEGQLELVEVKPAGARAMSARDFVNGRRVQIGDRFTTAAEPEGGP